MAKSNRIISFDILNIISCLGVVYLHQNSLVHQYDGSTSWYFALAIECIFYFAVPIFFMLTGANLMNYEERYTTIRFFKKRIRRTLLPFLIWSIIWMIIDIYTGNLNPHTLNIKSIITGIINTKFQSVYWFFIPLFVVYGMMPFLTKIRFDYSVMRYTLLFLFITVSCYPLLCKIFDMEQNTNISNPIFGPLIYIISGYYLINKHLPKKYFKILGMLAILSIIIRYTVSCQINENLQNNRILFGYYLPTSIFPPVFIYLAIIRIKIKTNEKMINLTTNIASCSLGVYLLHKIIIAAGLRILPALGLSDHSFLWLGILPLLTWFICIVIIYYSKKTKLGNLLFP